jgi:hypothetical protein
MKTKNYKLKVGNDDYRIYELTLGRDPDLYHDWTKSFNLQIVIKKPKMLLIFKKETKMPF